MFRRLIVLSAISTLALASPGNLGYGGGLAGVGLGVSGYGAGNQISVASGAASAAVSAVAAASPVGLGHSVVSGPVATSAQGRVDIVTPNQIVNQVSVVPVSPLRAISVGGHGGISGGPGLNGALGGLANGGGYNGLGYAGNRPGGYGY